MFMDSKKCIEEGDLVLVYVSRTIIKPIYVTPGKHFNTRFGSFPHDSMIGLEFGSQITTPKDRGFVYLLKPTPELWTMSLPHRTQIVYTPDSSYILQRMDVRVGSRVIEAGTGSGSFTHAFARCVNTEGQLFSFEFHETRYQKALEEFTLHGLSNVTLTHRDVCKNGFDIEGTVLDADTVFLDLPSPWEAIPHLKRVLTTDRKVGICCFSPCFEQVVKAVEALQEDGWQGVELTEVQGRMFESHKAMKREVDDAVKRLKFVKEKQREGLELIKAGKHPRKEEKDRDYGFNPFGKGKRIMEGEEGFEWFDVSRLEAEVKTHTSYLVFAYKLPEIVPPQAETTAPSTS
jgi:tRNA (adenine57-N1/adenine58-N1)-methyltransferase